MSLEDVLLRTTISDMAILERVDEYSLYCYYLGFEPLLRKRYHSFVRRGDDNPSFSLFEVDQPNREYFWKDAGLGEAGDIFKLIRIRFGYKNLQEVYHRIDYDFKLGFCSGEPPEKKIVLADPPPNIPSRIRIKSKNFTQEELKFWLNFGISKSTLDRYQVKSVQYYWLNDFQEIPKKPFKMGFAYLVQGKIKLYQPYSKNLKFRNDLTVKCLEGFSQLKYRSDTLIITKSMKDVMLLDQLGYEAVSPRGENILVPRPYMQHFRKHYKKIYILFDNDMKHKGDEYPEPKVYVPLTSGQKDISDFRKAYGEKNTKELLQTIIL